jgi:hypothetical protein
MRLPLTLDSLLSPLTLSLNAAIMRERGGRKREIGEKKKNVSKTKNGTILLRFPFLCLSLQTQESL